MITSQRKITKQEDKGNTKELETRNDVEMAIVGPKTNSQITRQ